MSLYTEYAKFLVLEGETADRNARRKKAISLGLVGLGGNAYGKEAGGETTHIQDPNDPRNIIPYDPKKHGDDPKNANAKDTTPIPQKIDPRTIQVPTGKSKVKATDIISTAEFSTILQKRREDTIRKLDGSPTMRTMKSELLPKAKQFYARLNDLTKMPAGKKRRDAIEDFIKFYSVANAGSKLYAYAFPRTGRMYKVFGDSIGKDAKYFINLAAEEGIVLPGVKNKEGHVKNILASLSKPDFGKKRNILDARVKHIFQSSEILDRLPKYYKSIFGPLGPDGVVLQSGGKNARAYFEHSVKTNKGIKKTLEWLEAEATNQGQSLSDTKGHAGAATALRAFTKNMNVALASFDKLSVDKRTELIQGIYFRLAHDLHVADKQIASTIMKNVAEVALYDLEIAEGKEVYLPAEGTFPTGDKLVVTRTGTKVEKIEAISIKFGKNSMQSYGLASSVGTMLIYHPDPTYKDLIASRAGIPGYETGISGERIHDPSSFKQMAKYSDFHKAFDEKTLEKIRTIGIEITLATKQHRTEIVRNNGGKKFTNKDSDTMLSNPKLKQLWTELHHTMQRGDQKKLHAILGDHNYKSMMQDSHYAMSIYSFMAFGMALKTSNGLDMILHNHQEYKNGRLISVTEEGTPDLRDWQMGWIPYGFRGGGLKMGFNKQH